MTKTCKSGLYLGHKSWKSHTVSLQRKTFEGCYQGAPQAYTIIAMAKQKGPPGATGHKCQLSHTWTPTPTGQLTCVRTLGFLLMQWLTGRLHLFYCAAPLAASTLLSVWLKEKKLDGWMDALWLHSVVEKSRVRMSRWEWIQWKKS